MGSLERRQSTFELLGDTSEQFFHVVRRSSSTEPPWSYQRQQYMDTMSPKWMMSSSSREVAAMVRHLVDTKGIRSAEILRSFRKSVKRGGQLPEEQRYELFQAFHHMLRDINWKVVRECTMLTVDIVPQMGIYELDQCMNLVLPRVTQNLGHDSTDVRRASLRLLHVYMRYTNNLQRVLRTYVTCGLENGEMAAQKGAILSLPLLVTEELSNENLFPLVQSLARLLVSSDTNVFYPVFLALQRLHVLVGDANFKVYLDHIPADGRILYQKVLSRNNSASSGRSETSEHMFDTSFDNLTDPDGAISMDKFVTCGDAPKPMLESCGAMAGSFDTGTFMTSPEAPDYGHGLEWGLVESIPEPESVKREPQPIINRNVEKKAEKTIEWSIPMTNEQTEDEITTNQNDSRPPSGQANTRDVSPVQPETGSQDIESRSPSPTPVPPPAPTPMGDSLEIGNLRRMSNVTGSMPAISVPAGNEEQTKTITEEDVKQTEDEKPEPEAKQEATTRDAQTQKDLDSGRSTCGSSSSSCRQRTVETKPHVKRRGLRPRLSRSISPPRGHRHHYYHKTIRMQPAIPANANIRSILENVAKTEGPFVNPEEALRAAVSAFTQDVWHAGDQPPSCLSSANPGPGHPHNLGALAYEVKNLRSSVARSAIFTLGELFVRMKRYVEPEMDIMGQALLHKCGENVMFIREDIDKALSNMITEMPQSKSAITLIANGAKNICVRRTTAFYLSELVDKMGANKCLTGPRDIGEHLLPAAARFVMDGSPHTRYYGRKMFGQLMGHGFFDRLLRKYLSPTTFRNIVGILESIKRRGIGDRPLDLATK
ncbi:hypothetical protein HDE_02580 [Halotydeus destructor]|nr:hypothetical protein HDE_02580 [Halotydeus destructor]